MANERKMKSGGSTLDGDNIWLILATIGLVGIFVNYYWRSVALYLLDFVFDHRKEILAGLIVVVLMGIWFVYDRFMHYLDGKRADRILDENEFCIGTDDATGKPVHILTAQRLTHMQIIGTTNAGKTSGVILPMCVHDVKVGNGFVLIDGKSERSLLDQIYAYASELGRKNDVQVFSLANPAISATYNPFLRGDAEQITERFFSSLKFENEYYKNEQVRIFLTAVSVLKVRGEQVLPSVIREAIRNREFLKAMSIGLADTALLSDVGAILKEKDDEYREKTSGIISALSLFCSGGVSALFNQPVSEIDLKHLYRGRGIVYFQLPTLMYQNLGPMVARMILAELKQILSEQQMASSPNPVKIFPLYLDDFNDYLDPSFESVLNKLRSAGLAAVFSHQSLSDLAKVSPEFKEGVLTNTNVKFFMRGSHPETNEYIAKFIGTRTVEKTTSRASTESGFFGSREVDTGERSVREVEEYIVHPNAMKNSFGLWQGTLVVPETNGRRIVEKVQAKPAPLLPTLSLPVRSIEARPLAPIVARWIGAQVSSPAKPDGSATTPRNAEKVAFLQSVQKENEGK